MPPRTRAYLLERQVPPNLRLGPSTIRGAGLGLFARRALRQGAVIGTYQGRRLTIALAQRSANTDYQMHVDDSKGNEWIIDGLVGGNYTRFVNHACYADEQNAKFKFNSRSRVVQVIAIRPIRADEEILVSYGQDYSRVLCMQRYLRELRRGHLDYEQFVNICTRTGETRRQCGVLARASI